MLKSWKTTLTGVLAILVAVFSAASAAINGHPVDYAATLAAILAGIGLISAKDGQVTGGTIKQ
jgi:hypothetical protein